MYWCRVAPGDGVLTGEAAGHEVGHREVDHGFGAVGVGFVVACQASVQHQPAVGPLNRPPLRDRGEAPGPGGALDDLQVDAEAQGGVVDGGLLQESSAGGGVLHGGRGDQYRQQQAEGVGDDAALAAHDLLASVDALRPGGDRGGGLDALGVDHAGRGVSVFAFLLAYQLP